MLPNLSDLSYPDRLRKLKLPSLKFRRLRGGGMIEVFKIVRGMYDDRVTGNIFDLTPDTTTRGHQYKIVKKRCRLDQRKHYFTNRVVDVWNNFPSSVVSTKNVKTFENRLDRVWKEHPMMYDYVESHQTGSRVHKRTFNIDLNTEEQTSSCVQ